MHVIVGPDLNLTNLQAHWKLEYNLYVRSFPTFFLSFFLLVTLLSRGSGKKQVGRYFILTHAHSETTSNLPSTSYF